MFSVFPSLLYEALVESSIVCCRCSLNVTEDGKKALMTLANGDMRKVLNVLQVKALPNVFYCLNYSVNLF